MQHSVALHALVEALISSVYEGMGGWRMLHARATERVLREGNPRTIRSLSTAGHTYLQVQASHLATAVVLLSSYSVGYACMQL